MRCIFILIHYTNSISTGIVVHLLANLKNTKTTAGRSSVIKRHLLETN